MFLEMFLPLAVIAASGAGAWLCGKWKKLAAGIGTTGLIAGILSWGVLLIFNFSQYSEVLLWSIPVQILGFCGAIHSLAYLKGHGEERSNLYYLFYNLTVGAMLGVLLAKTPIHFLVFWELMGLASFALVSFDYKSGKTRDASWVYLLVCEAGSLFLILMFLAPETGVLRFIFGLIGFGLKIGLPLLHMWLPQAHPAAPAPVSALMSGAMIPLGFYGLGTFVFSVQEAKFSVAAGIVLLALGGIGALGGILFALPRTNIKELLAYSSIENMGIIAMGFGLGLLDSNIESQIFVFGMGGALLHIINHAFLKGGLFLGAGIIQKATHSLEMEEMGGLLKRTPFSGSLFLLNSAGICGLPPFNGFISEFLIYMAALTAICSGKLLFIVCGAFVLIVLALTGGIAAAAFAKLTGAVYLGEPRSQKSAEAEEQSKLMTIPVLFLFLFSCGVTLLTGWLGREWGASSLFKIALLSVIFVLLTAILFWIRCKVLPGRKEDKRGCTWDCGYIAPTARMEYTGSAFVQPITDFCRFLMKPFRKIVNPKGIFAKECSYESETADPGVARFWGKIFSWFAGISEKIHVLQSGYLHLYILITTVALIAMLIWGLMLPWSGSVIGGVK